MSHRTHRVRIGAVAFALIVAAAACGRTRPGVTRSAARKLHGSVQLVRVAAAVGDRDAATSAIDPSSRPCTALRADGRVSDDAAVRIRRAIARVRADIDVDPDHHHYHHDDHDHHDADPATECAEEAEGTEGARPRPAPRQGARLSAAGIAGRRAVSGGGQPRPERMIDASAGRGRCVPNWYEAASDGAVHTWSMK